MCMMKNKKIYINVLVASFCAFAGAYLTGCGCEKPKCDGATAVAKKADVAYNIPRGDLRIRDPFVFADPVSKKYYIPCNLRSQPTAGHGKGLGLCMFESPDLENWRDLGNVFTPDADFWGKSDFWAPDMFYMNGKYYIIATFSTPAIKVDTYKNEKVPLRASSVLVADRPEGPYKPLVNAPATPTDKMCLDATLFDDGKDLWLVYSHEWVQCRDGEMMAHKISRDLKTALSEPILLFKASESKCANVNAPQICTDAPVVYKADNGKLFMLWSGFSPDWRYQVMCAVSDDGTMTGKWRQLDAPVNFDRGGHCMLFKGFDGNVYISYHIQNQDSSNAPVKIRPFKFDGEKPVLGDYK